jgi:hypothetical protein
MTPELVPLAQDTSRLLDRRIGLAMSIPGRPRLVESALPASRQSEPTFPAPEHTPRPREPSYEVQLALADVPITIRYRYNQHDAPRNLHTLAEVYAANRCRVEDRSRAFPARAEQLAAWHVDGGASCVYPLREPAPDGDTEEVLLLARGDALVTITKRFPRDQLSPVAWALCNTAIAAELRWDPAALDAPPAPLWPESTFLVEGVRGILRPARRADAIRIAELAQSITADARELLADAARRLLSGSEPPSRVVPPAERAALATYFANELASAPALEPTFARLLAEAKTSFDVRGACILLLHALGRDRAAFEGDGTGEAFEHFAD